MQTEDSRTERQCMQLVKTDTRSYLPLYPAGPSWHRLTVHRDPPTLNRSSLTGAVFSGDRADDDRRPSINTFRFIVDFCRQINADKSCVACQWSSVMSSARNHRRSTRAPAASLHRISGLNSASFSTFD